MGETTSTTRNRNLAFYSLTLFSCAAAGAIAGGAALNNKHQDMADRIVYCSGLEPQADTVTGLTQFCLDESNGNDTQLQGSPVTQEFALGTPLDELRTVAGQYRENDVDPGIVGGGAAGLVVGAAGIVLLAPWIRERTEAAYAPAPSDETAVLRQPDDEPETTASGATVWRPEQTIQEQTTARSTEQTHQIQSGATKLPELPQAG